MCNWFTKLFCGKNCKCHSEEKAPTAPNIPNMNASAEVKPNSESNQTPEQKM
jgi:hypothetical protein